MRFGFLGILFPLHIHAKEDTTSFKWDSNWDGREISSDPQIKRTKARRHLILVRHGQYHHKAASKDDHVLTKLGRKQALSTGLWLLQNQMQFDRIVQSSVKRAMETADIICRSLNVKNWETDPDLSEGFPCVPTPYSPKVLETHEMDGERIERAFRRYFHRPPVAQKKDTYDLLICHANVIRYFLCRSLQLPSDAWLRFSLNHGSFVWLTILSDGRVVLRQYSNCGYMLPEELSS